MKKKKETSPSLRAWRPPSKSPERELTPEKSRESAKKPEIYRSVIQNQQKVSAKKQKPIK
jgi:hypothetical protein